MDERDVNDTVDHQQPAAPQPTENSKWERILKVWNLMSDIGSQKIFATIALLIVIAIVAVSGGLKSVTTEGTRHITSTLKIGQPLQTGPFQLTFINIETTSNCQYNSSKFPKCIRAQVKVLNTFERYVEDHLFAQHLIDSGLIKLSKGKDKAPTNNTAPYISLADKKTPAGAFQPDIERTVYLSWNIASDAKPCDLNIVIYKANWVRSSLDLHQYWQIGDPLKQLPACIHKEAQ